jgi:hypothetical protein
MDAQREGMELGGQAGSMEKDPFFPHQQAVNPTVPNLTG